MKKLINFVLYNRDYADLLMVGMFVLTLWLVPAFLLVVFITAVVWLLCHIVYTLLND